MRDYETVYPLFEDQIWNMRKMIGQQIEFPKYPNPNTFLHILDNNLENLRNILSENPSVNAQNLAYIINNTYLKGNKMGVETDGVLLRVYFKKNSCPTRLSKLTLNLY